MKIIVVIIIQLTFQNSDLLITHDMKFNIHFTYVGLILLY